CAFRETRVYPADFGVDHFRPKSRALDLDGRVDPDHYWWLAYEWENLYPVCSFCNMSKHGAQLPFTAVAGTSARHSVQDVQGRGGPAGVEPLVPWQMRILRKPLRPGLPGRHRTLSPQSRSRDRRETSKARLLLARRDLV